MADTEIASVFSESAVLCGTDITESGELMAKMVGMLSDRLGGAKGILEAVLEREASSPTFIAKNVALPHARLDDIDRTVLAIATSREGVSFGGVGGPANLVLLVLTPKCAPIAYLRVAASVARSIRDKGFMDRILACRDAGEVRALFCGEDRALTGEVCAADIMERPSAVLRETDSVKDAIDMIVRLGQTEIPVVDKEGDLVGEASADEVLSLCIPDYLLWMEDLSGFSNFAPFATLLRKESSTWLADIMSDDYASVSVDQPAIAVAEALARKDAGVCYVLDDGKLVGVVTLPHFLNKIFRD
ncbi:MAG: PTS sugar transporter subunit IIA [Kiritimatiellae bacterium]|nr:PTS sugar transporter subunit IIA [Kiritimatiellia bacterium]